MIIVLIVPKNIPTTTMMIKCKTIMNNNTIIESIHDENDDKAQVNNQPSTTNINASTTHDDDN